jgi:hypothetical protein
MLQVRAGSWHYWIWRLGRSSQSRPKNLCCYFWHCVFKILAALFVVGLALTGAGAIMYLVLSFPAFFGMGVVGLAIIILLVIGFGYIVGAWVDRRHANAPKREQRKAERLKAEYEAREARRNKPPGAWGLTWTFIKAKKAKYCPLIQVVDE